MTLEAIQNFYDRVCQDCNILSVKAYFVITHVDSLKLAGVPLNYVGLYQERPFRKIFLNRTLFNRRTVYHEIFHHVRTDLKDGPEFEFLLDAFIQVLHQKQLLIDSEQPLEPQF